MFFWPSQTYIYVECEEEGYGADNWPIYRYDWAADKTELWVRMDIHDTGGNGKYFIGIKSGTGNKLCVVDIASREVLWTSQKGYGLRRWGVPGSSDAFYFHKNGGIMLDSKTGAEKFPFEYFNTPCAVTSNGKWLATAFKNKIAFLDMKTGALTRYLDVENNIACQTEWTIVFGPDSETVAQQEATQKAAEVVSNEAQAKKRAEQKAESETLIKRAFDYIRLKQPDLAIKALENAVEAAPEDGSAACVLGLIKIFHEKESADAYTLFSKCVKSDVAEPVYLNNFAVVALWEKKYDFALTAMEKMAKVSPNSPELIQNLGLFMRANKRKFIKLTEKQNVRLLDLYANVCLDKENQISQTKGWLFLPLRKGSANRPECDTYFVRRGVGKNTPPFEIFKSIKQ